VDKKQREYKIIESALDMFSRKGFYSTTVAQIAKSIGMSVGHFYNFFPSKNSLAKASITFVTKKLADELHKINELNISSKDKIHMFVLSYLDFLEKNPQMIDYFFKVYLANREMFSQDGDSGFELAKAFIDEIEILINSGIESKEFCKKDFYVSFSCITGILGGITFLNGEGVLNKDVNIYAKELSDSIVKALQ